ncbi:MAG: choice-of-anchor V domain-containing protein [Steroidobacteraceae bacterium]
MPANCARHNATPLVVLGSALLPGPALVALHFRDGPPASVTGGFGEDSCQVCHFGDSVNDAGGRLSLHGFPERYTPGKIYEFELALSRPKMAAAGFELAIRHAGDRTQAGRIAVSADDEASVGLLDERGVQFAHHLQADAAPDAKTVRWQLSWTAPEVAAPVVVHASAVAGDGDESQLGDYVYTLEAAAGPGEMPLP